MAFKAFKNAKDKFANRASSPDSSDLEASDSGRAEHASRSEGDGRHGVRGRVARAIPRGFSPDRTIPPHPGSSISFQDESPYRGAQKGGKVRKRKPNWITRQVNRWVNRLVGAVSDGTFAEQEEQYASHRTTRDYVWNTIGLASWGVVFPVLSIVVTQLVGAEQAGMFAMAFTVALLLMFVANYGVRTYQVSDLEEEHSFSDYQANRILTCAIMLAVGFAYGAFRGYGGEMMTICAGVYVYKMVDGWADVYEGRLQQMDKLYLAGISQTFRSVAVLVVFSLVLLITRSLTISCIVMGVVALLTLFFLTIPLALFETPKSRRLSPVSVVVLLKQCFPLFVALFMYNLIENMPKFMMEGMLPYENQLYYNAMWFPANALVIFVQVIYKPLLVRMAGIWADMRTRKRFDILVVAMLAVVVAITCGVCALMWAVGAPVLGFLYGVDFEPYRGLIVVMVVAGGVSAAIDFLYQAVTLLRKQGSVTKLYLITFGFSLFIPVLLVGFTGLPGAVLSYLIIMSFLLVLLVWEYLRIRIALANEPVEEPVSPRAGGRVRNREEAARMPARRDRRTGAGFGSRSKAPVDASNVGRGLVDGRDAHDVRASRPVTRPLAREDASSAIRQPANFVQQQSAGAHARPRVYDDYAGVEVDEMSPREKARAAHADRLRREQAAAKRAERAARRSATPETAVQADRDVRADHVGGRHVRSARTDMDGHGAADSSGGRSQQGSQGPSRQGRPTKGRGAHGRGE